MRIVDGGIVSSPSDLCRFLESRFATWMDRYYLEHREPVPDTTTEDVEAIFDAGARYEATVLAGLRAEGRDIVEITGAEPLAETRRAVDAGRDMIYQAVLAHGDFAGVADFLVRVDGADHYEVWDVKLARRAKPYFMIQLCCYAEMLEALQGVRPEHLTVVLGTGERTRFRTDDYIYYYRALRQSYLDGLAAFQPEPRPAPDLGADHGRWTSHADAFLEETDHLLRVAGITTGQVKKLNGAGVATLTDLARAAPDHVRGIQEETLQRLRTQARLQLDSAGRGVPLFEVIPADPERPRRGLALLPPPSPEDVFFDMEGYPLVEGGLEYLFGATYLEDGARRFIDWWAPAAEQEQAAFEGFVDWAHARWRQDPAMHIYHYAAYEVTAMRRLMGTYGTREDEVDELLRNEVFVDLYTVVRQGLRVGEPAYSIKNLERLYRDARKGEVRTAAGSIVFFRRWLESDEPPRWRESPILKDIRDYNRDDCDSLVLLADWLRERQRESGIVHVPPGDAPAPEERTLSDYAVQKRALAESLLGRSDRNEIDALLGRLVEFHRREAKPEWWAIFDRQLRTREQLADDLNCLAGLRRTRRPRERAKQSWLFEYTFDSDQDTKLGEGDTCLIAHTLIGPVYIEELDRAAGRARLKLSARTLARLDGGEAPRTLSLIPGKPYDTRVLQDSIEELARAWSADRRLAPALRDFLERRPPRIRGHAGGPLHRPGDRPVDTARRVVPAMDETALCIQGPPGSGKTFTAANVILDLLARGCKVGVTSNSHKAILNLMRRCWSERGAPLRCAKVGGSGDDSFFQDNSAARHVRSNQAAGLVDDVRLVGGTAWLFAREDMRETLDYLFVDEAGQVSVANLVAMASSARNLVLIGDQMQLGQPIQGSHPGESGTSTLEYLLQGRATIPEDMGLFLDRTYRLHPKICSFISGAVYEGRLEPAPVCEGRVIRAPHDPGPIAAEAGIVFVPSEHEGNTQGSDEEAAKVAEIHASLLGRRKTDGDGEPAGTVTEDDIAVIAPYNMQVRKLRNALPGGARVGSVDRFQGQQAAAVILSMCASDGNATTRGIEFLFDRNRLNVALSRAQSLAIVVGHPALAHTRCNTVEQMRLVNLYCRILEESQ